MIVPQIVQFRSSDGTAIYKLNHNYHFIPNIKDMQYKYPIAIFQLLSPVSTIHGRILDITIDRILLPETDKLRTRGIVVKIDCERWAHRDGPLERRRERMT